MTHDPLATVPPTQPVRLAPETFLITNLADAGPDGYLPVNSMLIRGEQPVVVDTGAPIHRERWLQHVFGLVAPEDVRWVFLSHDDGDHTGALHDVLDLCPHATLVANAFACERLSLERAVPMDRVVWREPGEVLDVGDRRLRLVLPPIFDGPTTRALFDESTGVLWGVDSFASLTPGAVHHLEDLPVDLFEDSFALFNGLISPWLQWLDPAKYDALVDSSESLRPRVVATAHGPVLRGAAIHDAYDRVRELAGQPLAPPPGQADLDALLAGTTLGS